MRQGSLVVGLMAAGSISIRGSGLRQVVVVKRAAATSFARLPHNEYGIGVMLAGAQRSSTGRRHVEASTGDLNTGQMQDGMVIGDSPMWAMLYLDTHKVSAIASDMYGPLALDPDATSSRTSTLLRFEVRL
jgi:hypothetical protein